MKARRDTLRKMTTLHVDFYHRQRIDMAREEGKRLRDELIRLGVNPKTVLDARAR